MPLDGKLEFIKTYLEKESYLGGPNMEGVVIRNLGQDYLQGDIDLPFLIGKYVSEKFKEKMDGKVRYDKGSWERYMDSYKTEARWRKAIQHLRERGEFMGSLKDIGACINEVKQDITSEHREEIERYLWKKHGGNLLRRACQGFPEFFKDQLARGDFEQDQ